ncbi:MAG: alpha/beta fold hydrolase [Pseudobacteriovorax sp.]|nr:alpha/beta fold hydrolase [Pseudobacteriovorax sp.]
MKRSKTLLKSTMMALLAWGSTSGYGQIREDNYAQAMAEFAEPNFNAGDFSFFTGKDGASLRYGFFPANELATDTIVLLTGRSEEMEKYIELIYDFNQLNYNVFSMDHRGQGRSDRLHDKNDSGHVDSFFDYTADLATFMDTIVKPNSSGRIFLFAHSMGGAVATSYFKKNPDAVEAAVLSAPLLTLETGDFPPLVSQIIANVGSLVPDLQTSYVLGQGPASFDYDFEGSDASSRARYEYARDGRIARSEFQLGGPSFQWVKEIMNFTTIITLPGWAESVTTDMLLFQAEVDTFVRPKGQNRFCEHAPNCELRRVQGVAAPSKHSLYFTDDATRDQYLEEIHDFFQSH